LANLRIIMAIGAGNDVSNEGETKRLDPRYHAAMRRALKQAWELDGVDKSDRLIRNQAFLNRRPRPQLDRTVNAA